MNAIHFQVPTWFDVPGFLPMLDEIVQRERCRIYVSRAGFSQAAMVVPSDNPPGPPPSPGSTAPRSRRSQCAMGSTWPSPTSCKSPSLNSSG